MSELFNDSDPNLEVLMDLAKTQMRLLGDIAESLSEIAAGIHMKGANHARAMEGQPAAYTAEDFGFDLLIPKPDQAEADRQARIVAGEEEVCRICGCSDTKACREGCTWAGPGLCSSCAERGF